MTEIPSILTKRWYPLRYHPQQAKAFRSRARFVLGLAGRRSGKTEVIGKRRSIRKGLAFTSQPDGRIWFAAPTLDQARRIYWDDLKAFIPGKYVRSISEARLELTLFTGLTFGIAGLDKPQRIEGAPIDGIVLDEYADMKPEAWANSVRPGLDTPGREPGWATFIGKAKLGASHYRQLCIDAQSGRLPGWEYYHWSAESVLSVEAIAQAKRELDPLVYEYEYRANWAHADGRVYYPFSRTVHCAYRLPYDKFAQLIFCFDFNVSPGAAVVIQRQEWEHDKILHHPDGRSLTIDDTIDAVIGEVHIPSNSNSEKVAKKLAEDWKDHRGPVVCYGDASGGAKGSAKVSGSDWEIVRRVFRDTFKDRVRYKVKKGNPLERIRVNSLNARLLTADGRIHMMIDAVKAPAFAQDLEEVIWLKGGAWEIDDSDENRTHWSDGVGYFTDYEYPLTTETLTTEPLYI